MLSGQMLASGNVQSNQPSLRVSLYLTILTCTVDVKLLLRAATPEVSRQYERHRRARRHVVVEVSPVEVEGQRLAVGLEPRRHRGHEDR